MQRKSFIRILTCLLIFSVLLSSFPLQSFAAEETEEVVTYDEQEQITVEQEEYEQFDRQDVWTDEEQDQLLLSNSVNALQAPYADASGNMVWDSVWFGQYIQDDHNLDGDLNSDDKTPVKWRVLAVSNDTALLLSEQGLDCQKYNYNYSFWNRCTLRSWLNGYGEENNESKLDYTADNFLNRAFTKEEQAAINIHTIDTYDNYAWDSEYLFSTNDAVFLLSYEDIGTSKYKLLGNSNRQAINTDYAKAMGAISYLEKYGMWWLRTPGTVSDLCTLISYDGDINKFGYYGYYTNITVRPALYLNLSSENWQLAGSINSTGDISDNQIDPESAYGITDPDGSKWDCIYFGNYIQRDVNGDGYYDDEDKEPIRWRVLSVNEVDGEALLLSDKNLDTQPFHESRDSWKESVIRERLNDGFLEAVFSDTEQETIVLSELKNTDFEGNEYVTEDRIFLLSKEEVKEKAYGLQSSGYAGYCKPTQYAVSNNVWVADYEKGDVRAKYNGGCNWWLRSPGFQPSFSSCVQYDGSVNDAVESNKTTYAIRPALWMKLSSDVWEYAGWVSSDGESGDSISSKPVPKAEDEDTETEGDEGGSTSGNESGGGNGESEGTDGGSTSENTYENPPEYLDIYNVRLQYNNQGKGWIDNISPYRPVLVWPVTLNGTIDVCDVKVYDGCEISFMLTPDDGYQMAYITAFEGENSLKLEESPAGELVSKDGNIFVSSQQSDGSRKIIIKDVYDDFTVKVTFRKIETDSSIAPSVDIAGNITWNCIWFGNYYQSYEDEKEPIKWRVLSVSDNKALLLSDKNLDCRQFSTQDTSWGGSTLRSWLNGYGAESNICNEDYAADNFLYTAFNGQEQQAILSTHLKDEDYDVWDKVYLLSFDDAVCDDYGFMSYLEDMARRCQNTEYAKLHGAKTVVSTESENSFAGMEFGKWWLRTYDQRLDCVECILPNGEIEDFPEPPETKDVGVRPVLCLDLSDTSIWSPAGTVTSDGKAEETKDEIKAEEIKIFCQGQNITKDTVFMTQNDKIVLSAEILPSNVTSKKVIWSVDKRDIISIDSKGEVTALAAGTAVVSAKTKDGTVSASCNIVVNEITDNCFTLVTKQKANIDEVMHSPSGVVIKKYKTFPVDENGQILRNAKGKPLSGAKYLSINSKGIMTAKNQDAYVKIVAYDTGGNEAAECIVRVIKPKLAKSGDLPVLVKPGDTIPMAEYLTDIPFSGSTLKWSIASSRLAEIDPVTGVLTANGSGSGKTTVIASFSHSYRDVKGVIRSSTVKFKTSVAIKLPKMSKVTYKGKVGKNLNLKMSNLTGQKVEWVVKEDGVIKLLSTKDSASASTVCLVAQKPGFTSVTAVINGIEYIFYITIL